MDFQNPLSFSSITDFLVAILNVTTIIALPIVVFFLIYAGFLYVTARGNPTQIQTASRALIYGIIGGVIIIGSVAIVTIVKGTVTAFAP